MALEDRGPLLEQSQREASLISFQTSSMVVFSVIRPAGRGEGEVRERSYRSGVGVYRMTGLPASLLFVGSVTVRR